MSEERILYIWLLYNWETREKKYFNNDHEMHWLSNWRASKGEHLYLLETYLHPTEHPERPQIRSMSIVREHERTLRPLGADETIFDYMMFNIVSAIEQDGLPPGTYGREQGPFEFHRALSEGKPTKSICYVAFPGHKLRITVEEVEPEKLAISPTKTGGVT